MKYSAPLFNPQDALSNDQRSAAATHADTQAQAEVRRAYSKPQISHLGMLFEVTQKSGGATDGAAAKMA